MDNVSLTLFTRNKNQLLKNISVGNTVIEGDAMNYNDIRNAVSGQDMVYVNLAGNLEVMASLHPTGRKYWYLTRN